MWSVGLNLPSFPSACVDRHTSRGRGAVCTPECTSRCARADVCSREPTTGGRFLGGGTLAFRVSCLCGDTCACSGCLPAPHTGVCVGVGSAGWCWGWLWPTVMNVASVLCSAAMGVAAALNRLCTQPPDGPYDLRPMGHPISSASPSLRHPHQAKPPTLFKTLLWLLTAAPRMWAKTFRAQVWP